MTIPGWLEQDRTRIIMLLALAAIIYLPVGFTDYLYTDEAVQLWNYRPDTSFRMFTPQGRFLTDHLFQWFFGAATRVADLRWLRGFSLIGWLAMIPLWYKMLAYVVRKEELPDSFVPMFMVALICSPTFCISVNWSSCMELFIAYSAGLASGWFFYRRLRGNPATPNYYIALSVLTALVSLFTYQNGIGLFLLPFLLIVLGKRNEIRVVVRGIGGFLALLAIYFLLFRLQLHLLDITPSDRTTPGLNILKKAEFFIGVTVAAAFRFGVLVNEQSRAGAVISGVIMLLLLYGAYRYFRRTGATGWQRCLLIIAVTVLCYLPSLLVRENYASNRTQLAVNLFVFSCTLMTMFRVLKTGYGRVVLVLLVFSFYMITGVYQYHLLFRTPVVTEYQGWQQAFTGVNASTRSVLVERPAEDYFVKRYGITRSWDEFGVPSMHFNWVPPFYIHQLLYERTGDRAYAESIQVHSYLEGEPVPEASTPEVLLTLRNQSTDR